MIMHDEFLLLTGHKPFPWQRRLLKLWSSADFSSDVLSLETGTGKTSTIAIWLAALIQNPSQVPRRLIYVVNRRTVVDQTTDEINTISNRLQGTKLESKLRQLSVLSLEPNEPALAVSTLRGQLADNRLWSADPARPSVIVGTVDMIGSRLLFGGYGIGWKTRPLHAGFLGQDTIIIHDECHLEPAFQTLLESIKNIQANSPRSPKIIALSATPRKGENKSFELDKYDFKHQVLKKRLTASKILSLHTVAHRKNIHEAIAQKALTYSESNCPILVFSNSVENALKIQKTLTKKKLETRMLTGTMRGLERDALVNDPVFQQFLPSPEISLPETVYLIATSAGEVGVNLSATHLVCDLVPYDRMAQRLGRLNRFGHCDNATVDVFHTSQLDNDSLAQTLQLLKSLNGDASPRGLAQLNAEDRDRASTPAPTIVPATDILFDALSLTSLRDLPTSPDSLTPLLHGIVEKEKPRTTIAWREEVDVLVGSLENVFEPSELLESFRLKPHETLCDSSNRVLKELKTLAESHSEKVVWLSDLRGRVQTKKLGAILDIGILAYRTVVLPPSMGGLSSTGTLDGKATPSGTSLDVCCHYKDRLRTHDVPWPGKEWKLVRRLDLSEGGSDASRIWSWYENAWGGDGVGQQTSEVVFLADHEKLVASLAKAMAESLGFETEVCDAIEFAGLKHDRGKSRQTWQSAAGNTHNSPAVAKPLERSFSGAGFRHELASLIDLQSDLNFAAFSDLHRDLIQHLVAAHHGRARPAFPENEIFDPDTPRRLAVAVAEKVPTRFANLQERFGHWGLAYIESILRAADYAASAGRCHQGNLK